MSRLFRIEWLKIRSNATFWVLAGLHVAIILLIVLSGKLIIQSLAVKDGTFRNLVDAHIPIFDFPDIWHNLTYIAGFLKFILAIYVIISITNEIAFDTLRQNVMNGMSRNEFISSKLLLVLLLAAGSAVFVFLTAFVTGLVSSEEITTADMIKYSGFVPAYFLELTAYLILALLIGLLIKRTGLAMGIMFLYTLIIEPVISLRIHNDTIKGLLPVKAIGNLIHLPFGKYILREIQDYVSLREISIVVLYVVLFVYFIHLILKKRDLK